MPFLRGLFNDQPDNTAEESSVGHPFFYSPEEVEPLPLEYL